MSTLTVTVAPTLCEAICEGLKLVIDEPLAIIASNYGQEGTTRYFVEPEGGALIRTGEHHTHTVHCDLSVKAVG